MLPSTIQSIHAASQENGIEYEIVVADDNSDDDTAKVAREHGAIVVSAKNRQIAATRNAGARASTGEYLIWVDADTRVSAVVVCKAIQALSLGAAGGGSRVAYDRPCPLYIRIGWSMLMLSYRIFGYASGAFIFCTRTVFEEIGGFDETRYAGEEIYMSRSIRKYGRFHWIKNPVLTSSRKLRSFSILEVLMMCIHLALGGHRGTQSRNHKDFWYGARRADTIDPPTPPNE